jgi:hypothetical protein
MAEIRPLETINIPGGYLTYLGENSGNNCLFRPVTGTGCIMDARKPCSRSRKKKPQDPLRLVKTPNTHYLMFLNCHFICYPVAAISRLKIIRQYQERHISFEHHFLDITFYK